MAHVRLTIQKEILLLILFMGLIPAVIAVVLGTQSGVLLFARTAGGPLVSRALEISERMDRLSEGYGNAVREIIARRAGDERGIIAEIGALGNIDAFFSYASDEDNQFVQLGQRQIARAEAVALLLPYCRDMLARGTPAPGGFWDDAMLPLEDRSTGAGHLLHFHRQNGRILVFVIQTDWMLQLIRASLSDQNEVQLFSRHGYLLSSNSAPPGLVEFTAESFRENPRGSSGMFSWRRRESGRLAWRLVAHATSRRLARLTTAQQAAAPWTLLITYDMEAFLGPHAVLIWTSIVLGLLWMLALIVLSVWAGRRIVGPIKQLRRQAEAMAAGDLNVHADVRTQDELEDLAGAFNAMASRLRESYDRITRFNQELEAKVIDRTRDLARANQRLIQTEKYTATGRLAANLAHEINNPLGIIKNYLRLTMNQLGATGGGRRRTDPNLERFQIVNEELDRIARIVRQLLDLHRPAGDEVKPTDLNLLIDSILTLMEQQLEDGRIEIVRDYDHDLPTLRVAPDLMRQVLLNLIRNAQDAMEGGGVLTVRTGVLDEWDGEGARLSVFFSVADTGSGIDPEQLARIFDPFFTTKSPDKGTGLGLAVSNSIVQQYHGLIEAVSRRGEGTTMTVNLPVTPPAVASPVPNAQPGDTPPPQGRA